MMAVFFLIKKDSIVLTTNKGYLTIIEKKIIHNHKIYNFWRVPNQREVKILFRYEEKDEYKF